MLFVVAALLAVIVPTASARAGGTLDWTNCGGGYQCAHLKVPRDYGNPDGPKFNLAIIRLPAQEHRRGALFVNFGGPGGTSVDTIHAIGSDLFGAVNDHFDIVGVDPRGVGETQPSVDCRVNQERKGIYSQPFVTPFNLDVDALVAKDRAYINRCKDLNGNVLRYISTANTARDMDRVRAAIGDAKLNYLGFSYGTFLGATYASMFPHRYRGMVLDGPLDVDGWVNRPMQNLREQSAGFERALARFFQACAGHQGFCGFGGSDPGAAFDDLVDAAYIAPLPATGDDPRPVDGDDMVAGAIIAMYAKQFWPLLVDALQEADHGDGTGFRSLADAFYARNPDGTYDPGSDRYFLITAADQRYERGIAPYLTAGNESWGLFDHAWWNAGYVELNYGLYDPHSNSVYRGPFKASASAPTMLEVATRYDPAAPYRGALRTVAQLGNVRLLTMRGDGHTAYGGNSPCIDRAVNAYIETLVLPPKGKVCRQEVPFNPAAAKVSAREKAALFMRMAQHRVPR
ncbi:MAG TPA: alpha/beta hydrolase [Gaiellaceae bacterium]|jgi:pimeloyl-ACP methyl ester carboxylesterase